MKVHCPVCGEGVETEASVETVQKHGAYLDVTFKDASPDHKCPPEPAITPSAECNVCGHKCDKPCGPDPTVDSHTAFDDANVWHNGGPHSRACGIIAHDHGRQCSKDCPTCHGKPL